MKVKYYTFILLFIALNCYKAIGADKALVFDGNNDYVQIANSSGISPSSELTLEAWIYPTNVSGEKKIITKFGEISNNDAYSFGLLNASVKFQIKIGSNWYGPTCSTVISTNQWYHIAGVYDGSTMKVFVNGVLDGSLAVTGMINTSSSNIRIGNWASGDNFAGKIDDVRIWHRARSQNEINTTKNCEISGTSCDLKVYYTFNNSLAIVNGLNLLLNSVTDNSGNSNTGNLINFSLLGSTSNWTVGTDSVSGNCTASSSSIVVMGNGKSIIDGDASPYSADNTLIGKAIGNPIAHTFQVYNSGTEMLELAFSLSGTNASAYTLSAASATLESGDTITLSATLISTAAGNYTATINLASSCLSQTFDFAIKSLLATAQEVPQFNGSVTNRVELEDIDISSSNFTIEAWVKFDNTTATQCVFSQGEFTTNKGLHVRYFNGNSIRFGYFLNDYDVSYTFDTAWHHLAVYQNKNTKKRGIYIDGNLIGEQSYTNDYNGTGTFYLSETFWINGESFYGNMREFRVWKIALTQDQLQARMNYQLTNCDSKWSDLLAYYRLDEGASKNVSDLTGESCLADINALSYETQSLVLGAYCTTGATEGDKLLSVSGNGKIISAGSSTVSSSNNTDLGVALVNGSKQYTYYLSNTGSSTLNINNVNILGSGSSSFDIIHEPTTIAANSTDSLVIEFSPTAIATYNATIAIINNGCSFSPYSFEIEGNGSYDLAYAGYGNSLLFDGVDDYVLQTDASIEFGSADFTIECWVKTTATSRGLLVKRNSNSTWEPTEKAFYIDADGKPTFVGWGNGYIYSTQPINDGNWHHVAVVWDYQSGITGNKYIYVDGIDVTSPTSFYASSYQDNSSHDLYIGSPNYFSGEAPNFFQGEIDDLRIWAAAKSATEIKNTMSLRLVGTEPNLKLYFNFDQINATTVKSFVANVSDGTLNNFPSSGYWTSRTDTVKIFMDENPALNQTLFKLPYYSADTNLSINFISGNANALFNLNTTTGALTANKPKMLDFETNPTVVMSYIAQNSLNTDTAIVLFSFNDITEFSIWTGSGNWTSDSSNWQKGYTPTSLDSIIVQSGNLEVTTTSAARVITLAAGNLQLSGGAVLTIDEAVYLESGNINFTNGNAGILEYSGNIYKNGALKLVSPDGVKVRLRGSIGL